MSGVTHTHIPVRRMLVRDRRRGRSLALAAVGAFAVLLVGLALALDGGDSSTTAGKQPAGQVAEQWHRLQIGHSAMPLAKQPDVDLRARAQTSSLAGTPAQSAAQPNFGSRYGGGPAEASRAAGSSSAANPGRPDGGPEEGSRGPGH